MGNEKKTKMSRILKTHMVDPKNLREILDMYHRFENEYFSDVQYSCQNVEKAFPQSNIPNIPKSFGNNAK